MMAAFHAVAARQSLSRPTDPRPVAAAQGSPWTPEVRQYVQRAFDAKIDGVSVEEMQAKLKKVITSLAEAGQVAHIDWTKYPLPQEIILMERAHQLSPFPPLPPVGFPPGVTPFMTASTLGKRKSAELEVPKPRAVTPPWEKKAKTNSLAERISGKSKAQEKKQKRAAAMRGDGADNNDSDAIARRRQRFGHVPANLEPYMANSHIEPTGPVVGTCQKLEKNYFRLTSAPKPEEVRPLPILREMMNLLRKKWKSEHNYAYACDQFKSLRQDLTVQHIRNEFTVLVYEAHARIALEMGDMGEYNQCQTQLKALYKQRLGGRPEEFTAYRILYQIYTCNRADMNNTLAELTPSDKAMEGVQHALKVRAALAAGNFHRFFRLYQDTPFMGAYLLDKCIERERIAALASLCRAYKPDLPLDFVVRELAFQGEEDDPDYGSRACVQFICDHGGAHLIVRKDEGTIRFMSGQAKNLFEDARRKAFAKVDIKGQI